MLMMLKTDWEMKERLLRERINRLESTVHAYDAMLNTGLADALRRRNSIVESALWAVVQKGLLPEAEQHELEMLLGNKFTPKY